MQRYVWWDEISKRELVRVDVRLPKGLHDFLRELAKRNSVSVNALAVGILTYAVDADRRKALRVEVIPAVRVADARPSNSPAEIPVQAPSPAARKRWRIR